MKIKTSNINQCKFLAGPDSFYYGNYAKRISPKWWGYYPVRSDPVRSLNQERRGISNHIYIPLDYEKKRMFLFKINSKSIYFGSILHIVLKLHQDHGGDFTQLEV